MVKTEDILSGVQSIVSNNSVFALIWHAAFYALIIALVFKWEPSNRLMSILLSLPLISVAVFAWSAGNPFNGSTFVLAAVLLLFFGMKTNNIPVNFSQTLFVASGIVMIVFGLVYPHFIHPDSIVKYTYASPFGLIPCPTLSVLIGFALLYNGFGSQPVTLLFIVFGLFYGIFGVLRLAVYLDIFLLMGAAALLMKYILALRTSTI